MTVPVSCQNQCPGSLNHLIAKSECGGEKILKIPNCQILRESKQTNMELDIMLCSYAQARNTIFSLVLMW